jgi:hypothetical protein
MYKVDQEPYDNRTEEEFVLGKHHVLITRQKLNELLGVSYKRKKKRVVRQEPRQAASLEFYFMF